MTTYVEVNGVRYPASIVGRTSDSDWNNRATKAITIKESYEKIKELFVDDITWDIICEESIKNLIGQDDEGNDIYEDIIDSSRFDNSEYSIVGDITVHQNGTVTVKMGKPTADELLAILLGG